MTPRVSVVVATYNYGRFLADAVNSALRQTMHDLEVIVVDDGSTDDTPQVMRAFAADDRVRFQRGEHLGQPGAKNIGISLARGEFVAFLDADDEWLPEKLARQIPLFDDPQVAVVYCRRIAMDEHGRNVAATQRPCYRGEVVERIFLQNFICFSSSVVRRGVLEEAGRFDESIPLAIDYDLWLKISIKHRFDYVDEPLVRYRTGHANLSRRGMERIEIARGIMDRFLNERGGRNLISRAAIRRAYAELCGDGAWMLRQRGAPPTDVARWYLRALAHRPRHWPAWKGLLGLALPGGLRDRLKAARQPASAASGG